LVELEGEHTSSRNKLEASKSEATQSNYTLDQLLRVKEEYIFVFSGFDERFLTSVEVFDVTRGIWREFPDLCSHRTKFQAIQGGDDKILLLGGKDSFAVQTDLVEEFSVRDMKAFPGDFKMPEALSGFGACLVRPDLLAVCGGSTGSKVLNQCWILQMGETVKVH